jgi:hypothetical protein
MNWKSLQGTNNRQRIREPDVARSGTKNPSIENDSSRRKTANQTPRCIPETIQKTPQTAASPRLNCKSMNTTPS